MKVAPLAPRRRCTCQLQSIHGSTVLVALPHVHCTLAAPMSVYCRNCGANQKADGSILIMCVCTSIAAFKVHNKDCLSDRIVEAVLCTLNAAVLVGAVSGERRCSVKCQLRLASLHRTGRKPTQPRSSHPRKLEVTNVTRPGCESITQRYYVDLVWTTGSRSWYVQGDEPHRLAELSAF